MSGRERILRAALECFGRDGVAGTSLSRLRAVAEVSPGAFYHHFPGKAEVVAALYVRILDGYHRGFLVELNRSPDPAVVVRGVVGFHVRWCVEHPEEAGFLFTERRPADDSGLRELNREFFQQVRAWWRAQEHHGALRALDLTTCHALWLGPAQELCRMWLSEQVDAPTPEQTATLADAAWRVLHA